MNRHAWIAASITITVLLACTQNRQVAFDEGASPAPPLAPSDGGDAAAPADAGDVPMCPVTTCSYPWATCASSEFPCATNLLSDDENCGGCGIRCEGVSLGSSKWTCVDGRCAFGCNTQGRHDCDGDPTNGCEVHLGSDKSHCGVCENQCAAGEDCEQGACIDPCIKNNLPDTCNGKCTNLKQNNKNCGTCGIQCDPNDPNLPPLPSDMLYGCDEGRCGDPQCKSPVEANCNGLISDGCEVKLGTDEHCTACNDACPPGKTCGQAANGTLKCLCDDGDTLCDGVCVNLNDDPRHCGGCNRTCPGLAVEGDFWREIRGFTATCTFGVCDGACDPGHADCDGFFGNGCEVNTNIDNRNCGGCGIACLAGQVCSQGACQMAPCDGGAPGVPQ